MAKKRKDKIKVIDIFAGCGGLTEGFEQTGLFETKACVEWDDYSCKTIVKRLRDKWSYKNAEDRVLCFDVRRTDELFNGWQNDNEYGSHRGLSSLLDEPIDVVIGGPPCQAYSVAGRIRDENGMEDDYRNDLFEDYLKIVDRIGPKVVLFENVPGILSASPGGISITDRIRKAFDKIGYLIPENIKRHAVVDASDYGVPQNRNRVILIGIRRKEFDDPAEILRIFYSDILAEYKSENKQTVSDAIFDLPKIYPVRAKKDRGANSHSVESGRINIPNHLPRFHNERDVSIFRELAKDITRKKKKYDSIKLLKRLYTEKTGKVSSIHKYFVLNPDEPSNTIVAHLYKDGLRHIHPDPDQARSITPREAARLQSFPDDFEFLGGMGAQYKMIGNAVPPFLAKVIGMSISVLIEKYIKDRYNQDDGGKIHGESIYSQAERAGVGSPQG